MRTESQLDLIPAQNVTIRFYSVDGIQDENRNPQPSVIEIVSASPNPFNSTVEISARVDGASPVDVAIHDINGKLVYRKQLPPNDSGDVHFLWDGKDFAGNPLTTGVYLVRIVAGDSDAVCRTILIR